MTEFYLDVMFHRTGGYRYFDVPVDVVEGLRRFEFTWEGSDELDPVSGSGWLRIVGDNNAEGNIKFHMGDSSGFKVEKV